MFSIRVLALLAVVGCHCQHVAGQCHSEGDKEYCEIGFTTTQKPDCHLVGTETVCFGANGPTSTIGGVAPPKTSVPAQATPAVAHGGHNEAEEGHGHGAAAAAPTPEKEEPHAEGDMPHDEATAHAGEEPHEGEMVPHDDDGATHADEMPGETEGGHGGHGGAASAEPHAEEENLLQDDGHGHGGPKVASAAACKLKNNAEYNLTLRIVAIFVILTTSSIGVLAPIFVRHKTKASSGGLVITFFKQFGTGVIISTVFIHLLMHATIQFQNPCIGELEYEGTVMAIAMGGAFLSFLVDFAGGQYLQKKYPKHQGRSLSPAQVREAFQNTPGLRPHPFDPTPPVMNEKTAFDYQIEELRAERSSPRPWPLDPEHEGHHKGHNAGEAEEKRLNVYIMEGGIIFHSILVGVLLTVTPDKSLPTLFAVVLIHQMFEGIALGARIGELDNVGYIKKIVMGFMFSCTSPVGMAIGVGVRTSFNSNDKSTILTLGTMDALSAGVLAWVAFVELWSKDWMHGGEMCEAATKKQVVGMVSLVLGILIMSVLGKWA